MDEKLTVDLDSDTMSVLADRAELHGRTVSEEVREIVRETVRRPISRDDLVARMRAFAASLPQQKTDSLTLLREDRDR